MKTDTQIEQARATAQREYDNMLPEEPELTPREVLQEASYSDFLTRITEQDIHTIRSFYEELKGSNEDFIVALVDFKAAKASFNAMKDHEKSFPKVYKKAKYEYDIAEERLIEILAGCFKDPEAKQRAVEFFIENELEVM